ncbi:hypothetical protein Pcinc_012116 [Petrolisthes cinctipes]|uniref:Uncharacterized protein n=1 Tax=Petrolisthes cinctipes TaxID=88211 RepID=A0AAE1FZI5_PETCI|nr:hypothetical protein Pcinc_012116 [Petrolisthes cinctipes]
MPGQFDRGGYDSGSYSGSSHHDYRVGHSSSPRDLREENRREQGYWPQSNMSGGEMRGYYNPSSRRSNSLSIEKSRVALDIISAVLAYDSPLNERQGPPPSKQPRMEWGGMRSDEELPRDHHYSQSVWERLGQGGSTHHHPSHFGSGDHQDRRMAKSHQSKPLYNARTSKSSSRDPQSKEGKAVPTPRREASTRTRGEEPKEERRENEDQRDAEDMLTEEDLNVPPEALKCHICSCFKFSSVRAYYQHLNGRRHKFLRTAYQAKITAMIGLLRSNSQMAELQRTPKTRLLSKNTANSKCVLCQCDMNFLKTHTSSWEHRALVRYVHGRCCGQSFTTRDKVEEHILSVEHHQNEWNRQKRQEKEKKKLEEREMNQEEGEKTGGRKRRICFNKHDDEEKLFGNVVEELHQKSRQPEVTSLKSLEPFDPAVPHGLNFLWKSVSYWCDVCPNAKMVHRNVMEQHFHGLEHYNNIVNHLKLKKDEKTPTQDQNKSRGRKRESDNSEEERLAMEDDDEDQVKEEEHSENEDEKEISCEDIGDMETVDEVVDDDAIVEKTEDDSCADDDDDPNNSDDPDKYDCDPSEDNGANKDEDTKDHHDKACDEEKIGEEAVDYETEDEETEKKIIINSTRGKHGRSFAPKSEEEED